MSVYATNLLQALDLPETHLLGNKTIAHYPTHPVPPSLSSDFAYAGLIKRLLWTQWQVPRLYSKLKGDLFFSPIPEAPLGVRFPTVVTVHDLIPLHFPKLLSVLRLYFKYYVSRVVRSASHVICDSKATARDLRDLLGVSVQHVSVIPLAYNAQHFRFLDLPRQDYFLYVGRHDHYKNLRRLVTAFAQLPEQTVRLKIAGAADGKNTPLLRQQVQALGLGDRVEFLSYVPYADLPQLINQAIALVFPSLWEGFGLPVLEAMACGTPVITSNLSSLPEVAGEAAILIDPYQVGEMAEAMQAVATDGQLWRSLRAAGLKQAQQFSWHKTAQATARVLAQYL
ncbi:MAG: glycosyltransferase family 1 protein [Cyanobacteria bacterium P01_G01_bin.54]